MASSNVNICSFFCHIFVLGYMIPFLVSVPLFEPQDILNASHSFCIVLFPEEALNDRTDKLLNTLAEVSFVNETSVLLGRIKEGPLAWPNGGPLQIRDSIPREELGESVLIFKRLKQDRTCLLVPNKNVAVPQGVPYRIPTYEEDRAVGHIVEFINHNCGTFRNKDGSLNVAGIHRREILDNLYSPSTQSSSSSQNSLSKCSSSSIKEQANREFCVLNTDTESVDTGPQQPYNQYLKEGATVEECERIDVPNSAHFFNEYLSHSKPVIITGATKNWTAFHKWTKQFLQESYGDKKVHIKITPDGQYEGVEPISLWEGYESFDIPESVFAKLPYPDLVVVRPASMEIPFAEFLDLVQNISSGAVTNISAYLEYSSIEDYFPELMEDISEMQFFRSILELKHLNIWLSDGNTLGKLHFDPFDNFLCQISGEKQVLLFEPHNNTRLYEGHIQEALLSYSTSEKLFYRRKLLDSTSMVMSPLDPLKPDLQRFPKFADVRPLNCTIRPGDVLFMPSFWWHEVQSKPDLSEHRNLAINFWYEPFLTREFPCPECGLDVNPKYFHLL